VASPKFQLNVYGEVPPEAEADTDTAVPTVPAAGTVAVTARASGLMTTLAEAVLTLAGVAESVAVTVIVSVPLTL
jgi:hypothetical protein